MGKPVSRYSRGYSRRAFEDDWENIHTILKNNASDNSSGWGGEGKISIIMNLGTTPS